MIKIVQTGPGTAAHAGTVRDSNGTGLLPVQTAVEGAATFRVMGRVSPEAPWLELKAAGTVPFIESLSWVPYLALEVTGGTGTVFLWIGEK